MADLRAGIEALARVLYLADYPDVPEAAEWWDLPKTNPEGFDHGSWVVQAATALAWFAAHLVRGEGTAGAYFGEGYEFALIHLDDEPVQADLARLRPDRPVRVTTAEWTCPACGSTTCPRAYCVLVDTASSAAIKAARIAA